MGTPDFAVAPLVKLLESGFNVVGVITAPDKPAGRGKKIRQSPVEVVPIEHGPITLYRSFNGTLVPRAKFVVAPKIGAEWSD